MFILGNGVEIPDEDVPIAKAYNFRCVAHPSQYMVCLHEEPPKSKNPNWRLEPLARFPVCNECHELVHRLSRTDAAFYLNQHRDKFHPSAVETIESLNSD